MEEWTCHPLEVLIDVFLDLETAFPSEVKKQPTRNHESQKKQTSSNPLQERMDSGEHPPWTIGKSVKHALGFTAWQSSSKHGHTYSSRSAGFRASLYADVKKKRGPGVLGGELAGTSVYLILPGGITTYEISYKTWKPWVWFRETPGWTLVPVALALAAYPLVTLNRGPLCRRRRRKRGQCLDCGYDLTGNVTGVCSECGTKIEHP